MITDINSEDRLVQQTFADHLPRSLGWESIYAYNQETFGPNGTLGRANEREVVLVRDLRDALKRLNPDLPEMAREQAIEKLTRIDFARSLVQHNREFYGFIRDGVPVDGATPAARRSTLGRRLSISATARQRQAQQPLSGRARTEDSGRAGAPLQPTCRSGLLCERLAAGLHRAEGRVSQHPGRLRRQPHGLPGRAQHRPRLPPQRIPGGQQRSTSARYGSITSKWEHFVEWKRNDEKDKGRLDAEILLDGMLAKERLLDLVENFILFDDSRAGGTRKIVARNHQVLGREQRRRVGAAAGRAEAAIPAGGAAAVSGSRG